jgi:hypothetical protein
LEQLDVGSLFIRVNLFNLDVVPKVCRKVSAICWVLECVKLFRRLEAVPDKELDMTAKGVPKQS